MSLSGELLVSPLVLYLFLAVPFPLKFCFSISVGLFFVLSLCCGLLLASSMAPVAS